MDYSIVVEIIVVVVVIPIIVSLWRTLAAIDESRNPVGFDAAFSADDTISERFGALLA